MSSSSSSVAAATDKDKVDGAVIFLHGLGDRGESWAPISRQFNAAFFGGKRIVWVFPTAPVVPVSCNGGARGTSWFDLWSIPVDENAREDKEGFERSVKGLVDTIEELQRKHGLPSAKIFIGGFSQVRAPLDPRSSLFILFAFDYISVLLFFLNHSSSLLSPPYSLILSTSSPREYLSIGHLPPSPPPPFPLHSSLVDEYERVRH